MRKMSIELLSLAFTAGVLTFFSPCAIAMFPAYVAYLMQLKSDDKGSVLTGLQVGLLVGLSASLVFLLMGLIPSILLANLAVYTITKQLLALTLIILGLLTISPREVFFPIPIPELKPNRNFLLLSIAYGIVYALTSLSCTLPVFLMIVFTAAASGGIVGVMASFTAYVLGFATPATLVATLAVISKEKAVRACKRSAPYFKKVSGILLVIAGIYLLVG